MFRSFGQAVGFRVQGFCSGLVPLNPKPGLGLSTGPLRVWGLRFLETSWQQGGRVFQLRIIVPTNILGGGDLPNLGLSVDAGFQFFVGSVRV